MSNIHFYPKEGTLPYKVSSFLTILVSFITIEEKAPG